MSLRANDVLPRILAPVIMRAWMARASVMALCLFAQGALAQAQEKPAKQGELDVTMQIIVDPDAKLPDEVVRKIPLPARRSAEPTQNTKQTPSQSSSSDDAAKGQERAREARELGSEMSERVKEKNQEAAEQREEARRAAAEERDQRERGPPADPPGRPSTPPGR